MAVSPVPPLLSGFIVGVDDQPEQTIRVVKGSDWEKYMRIFDGARIQLSADAAASATTLTLAPDHPAMASGDKLLFGESIIVTASGACAAGATSLSVTAITGPLKAKAYGRRLVKDLTGFDLELRVLENRGDAAAIITIAVTSDDDNTDPAGSGKADVAVIASDEGDTAAIEASLYFWVLWDTTEGAERMLQRGPFDLIAGGDLS